MPKNSLLKKVIVTEKYIMLGPADQEAAEAVTAPCHRCNQQQPELVAPAGTYTHHRADTVFHTDHRHTEHSHKHR